MSEDVLFFGDIQNEYRCFSLEYPCVIEYDNKEFQSVLHLYLYLKFNSDSEIRSKLLEITKGANIYDYQKILEPKKNSEYDFGDDMVNMSIAIQSRVEQHEVVKSLLLESKKKSLLYVVTHSILEPNLWSHSLIEPKDENDGSKNIFENDGQNLYGNILKMVRGNIVRNLNKKV